MNFNNFNDITCNKALNKFNKIRHFFKFYAFFQINKKT